MNAWAFINRVKSDLNQSQCVVSETLPHQHASRIRETARKLLPAQSASRTSQRILVAHQCVTFNEDALCFETDSGPALRDRARVSGNSAKVSITQP